MEMLLLRLWMLIALIVGSSDHQSIIHPTFYIGHAHASVYGVVSFECYNKRTSRRNVKHTSSLSFIHPATCYIAKHQPADHRSRLYSDKDVSIPTRHDDEIDVKMTYPIDDGRIYRFRGIVETGYGRGGKKLGFPTANIGPATFFDAAARTNNISTGVYFGYTIIEQQTTSLRNEEENDNIDNGDCSNGRDPNDIYKTVVNIGYSPTFVGQENRMTIIEAHLILPEETPTTRNDFYNATIRLQLMGFLRPEMKFASLPDLIQQITKDVTTAKQLLEDDAYDIHSTMTCVEDPFFVTDQQQPWIGSGGGNNTASYEIIPVPIPS